MSALVPALLLVLIKCHVCWGAQFLLTVPKEAYYDVDLVVSVSAFGLTPAQTETVTLDFRSQKDPSQLLNSTNMQFHSDGLQVYPVKFTWQQIHQQKETGVMVVMSSREHESKTTLNFSKNFGYIFIQTDKPIYTPLQTVKFRVIAVDEHQKLAKYMIRIDIKNHKQVVVDRFTQTAEEAFTAKEFQLPKDTAPGQWSITANFQGVDHMHGASRRVMFEVKEYVLPRFSTIISVDPDVITRGTEWVTVNVTSRYVYGRPVLGLVELSLGIFKPNEVTPLSVNYSEPLQNGSFIKHIKVGELFPSDLEYTRETRLYVKATVTESASLERQVTEDTSTFITHPYYRVEFYPSKKYFKPGFPYTLQVTVSAQTGRPASWVQLYVKPFFFSGAEILTSESSFHSLDINGKMKHDFNIPKNTTRVNFTVVVVDLKVLDNKNYKFEVQMLHSPNNEYVHISVSSFPKKNQDGRLLLRYSEPKQSASNKPNHMTVLVLAKGRIIFTTTSMRNFNGRSNVILPSPLYTEISPKMTVVAYYHVQSDTPEVVIDSLLVDTPEVCIEEITLTLPGSGDLYKPKDKYTLEVEGGPGMNVGFVAVDNAVLQLNKKQTLDRGMMFTQLGSRDMVNDGSDGTTVEKVFQSSGLHHMILDLDQPVTMRPLGVKEPNTQYDSIIPPQVIAAEDVLTQTVRNYFPESWFFEERKLPQDGFMEISLTLPDSITTWSFMAVGISSTRGICVSTPLEQPVRKLFFTDVRLPYKATRLEEVKVKIAVYNYHVYAAEVMVTVTGSDGLCFSANAIRGSTQNSTNFRLSIPAKQAKGEDIKVIPLRSGNLTLTVDVRSQNERDIVQRQLHVVAEGLRVRKSIKFVLDPEAKHATFRPSKKNKTVLYETSTLQNVFDLKNKEQQTTIDLALPTNAIRGTESGRILAFGDLMGDIITHAVLESRNLISTTVLEAEEVMGDLAPTIHALLSVQTLGLMDENLKKRGNKFVTHGVSRLTNYRNDDHSFFSNPDSKPCTWLTAFVLKTLCHGTSLAFIDKELTSKGFDWLFKQLNSDGSLKEQNWRIAKHVMEHKLMLSAEALIATMECQMSDEETSQHLRQHYLSHQAQLSNYLKTNLQRIKDPLVLAKVTYALMLFDPESPTFQEALYQLNNHQRKNRQGHIYWSKVEETNEAKNIPVWYCKGAHSFAIEATAYALLVFLRQGGTNTDAIADWLVGQRNYNGAFIGAMDTSVAIQALSQYSLQKHYQHLNLHCNITSKVLKEYFYSFKFTEENALLGKSVNNVPVGQVLDVNIKGQGLGQMQVNVEYNIPIDKNEHCQFKVTVDVKETVVNWSPDMFSNPLCSSCDFGCPKPVNESQTLPVQSLGDASPSKPAAKMTVKLSKALRAARNRKTGNRKPKTKQDKKKEQRSLNNRLKSAGMKNAHKTEQSPASRRQARSVVYNQATSKRSICIQVCFLHIQQGTSSSIEAQIQMLSGYHPVLADLDTMRTAATVRLVEYDNAQQVLTVRFTGISCTHQTCVAFRAVEEEEVGRRAPAKVEVFRTGSAAPECAMEYSGISASESLRVYCADFSHENRGECRCFSGVCSSCKPQPNDHLTFSSVKQMVCQKPIAYQLQFANVTDLVNWVEINSRVVSLNKTGSDNITTGSVIKLMSPSSCQCPITEYRNSTEKFYLLSTDVDRLVDRNGEYVYSYVLDEQSTFLRVSEPGTKGIPGISLHHGTLQLALNEPFNCFP